VVVKDDTKALCRAYGSKAPEDATGPLDDVEVEDLGYSETGMTAADWPAPRVIHRGTQRRKSSHWRIWSSMPACADQALATSSFLFDGRLACANVVSPDSDS
jgi:hypothetical protein